MSRKYFNLALLDTDYFPDAIYRKLKTGSFAPPKASVGLSGGVGLGPLSLGGKVGIGGGGFPSGKYKNKL